MKDWEVLGSWLNGVLYFSDESFKDVVENFVWGEGQPSWRKVIFSLDGAGETHLANRIRSYGESVQGE